MNGRRPIFCSPTWMKMFKNLISPVQAWLLSRGQCVGCGMPLEKGKLKKFDEYNDQVTCKCKRVYIFNKKDKKYRRALIDEIR